jgi:isopentenyl-diphosphate Delta-isomerase
LSGNELIDVVDEEDHTLMTRTLEDCLRDGLLHRAVTVFLTDTGGKIFLQQRSRLDDWLPGMWTASCTGHVKSGEDPDTAAARELWEELGLVSSPRFVFKFIVPAIAFSNRIEREIDFVFEVTSDQKVKINSKEVECGMFLTPEECKVFFKSRCAEITLDARLAFEKYLTI